MTVEFSRDHERYMKAFAFKVRNRAFAAGAASVQFEDIYQELCIAWCKARDAFSPEYGVPFIAFLSRGMHLHINRWIQDQITEGQHLTLDQPTTEDGEGVLHEVVPDKAPTPAEFAISEDMRQFVYSRLSKRARMFVEFLESPPEFLVEGLKAIRARAEYGRAKGIACIAPKQITASMVFEFMRVDRVERIEIYRELRSVQHTSVRRGHDRAKT